MDPSLLPVLLGWAVLLPLISFWVILLAANRLGKAAAIVAVSAIGGSCVLSFVSLFIWLGAHWPPPAVHHGGEGHASVERKLEDQSSGENRATTFVSLAEDAAPSASGKTPDERAVFEIPEPADESPEESAAHAASHSTHVDADHDAHSANDHSAHGGGHHATGPKPHLTNDYYLLGKFGGLRLTISYYIDALTVAMFCMVTLIATLIHCYAMGYMHDELHDITDKEVTLSDGKHLHRPGRFPRFFQSLSLFCFSMLGLVLAGNVAMVFVFWELVGICSYFLIGFYIERKSASTAANKAFIVNRVGDFGMLIGLMALWSGVGTFAFGDIDHNGDKEFQASEQGIFSLIRPADHDYKLTVPDGMVINDAKQEVAHIALDHARGGQSRDGAASEISAHVSEWRAKGYGYWLLVVAGVGIFCGCVGKSAQFPLHVWLPDAMEGPTPVSALVHSATMVAAGVYLVARTFPILAPEALLVIAIVGCITLFLAATIAITAVDIKRVLAYSTISQLGYMMLSLGVGGWKAGLMHLITHAFFKSLLFMCSGSVIHAVHTNDMRKMGGLLQKMPVTAITMLIGCLAIAGVGVPFVIGFSGYYSKDAILEQAYLFGQENTSAFAWVFFLAAAGGAAITAFYMFRMWYMTFVGKPRDAHAYDHAHESPPIMYMPLVILSVFAVAVAWDINLLGYGLVPVGFLIYLGVNHGWFTGSGHDAHGHDAHGHNAHGHDSHGHDAHGHDGHKHDSHGHDSHGHAHEEHRHGAAHDEHHGSSASLPSVSWPLLGGLLVASLLVGGFLQWRLPNSSLSLANLLGDAEPAGITNVMTGRWLAWNWPNEHDSHQAAIVTRATLIATGTWVLGIGLATLMYALGVLSPAEVRRTFEPIYQLLWNKWWFDELYNFLFVRPAHLIGRMIAEFDRVYIDGFLHGLARTVVAFSRGWDLIADRTVIDGSANLFGSWIYSLGLSLRGVQTGRLRQYVLFIVIGAIALFALMAVFWTPTLAR